MTTTQSDTIAQSLEHYDWAIVCEIGHTCDHHRPPCPNPAAWQVTGHDCQQPDAHDGYIDRYICNPHLRVIHAYIAALGYFYCKHCGLTFTPERWYIRIVPI